MIEIEKGPGLASKESRSGPILSIDKILLILEEKGGRGRVPPGRGPPCAKEKAPPMSGTPYPPTDLLRSTFGEEGLNFRVRNGIG